MYARRRKKDHIASLSITTLNALEKTLLRLENEGAAKEIAEKKIKACLQQAFKRVKTKDEQSRLYKSLSLDLHPDKINSWDHASYLRERELTDAPQRILAELRARNLPLTPIEWLMSVHQNVMLIYSIPQFLIVAINNQIN
jgi:hypothetical protein